MIRELTMDEVHFDIRCEPEDVPIEGNCSAIDPKTDRKQERWIQRQLDRGNEWAWCMVIVTARWRHYVATDVLGCCSYKSREDFLKDAYCSDMKQRAVENLNELLQDSYTNLKELEAA
jgi:hypothetical protein